jgi:nuclear pore complex protein Nup205
MFLVLSSRFFCIFSWWVICPFKTLNHSVHTQLLLANLDQPSPNVTHLLLRFDIDQPVERTVLQPKRHFRYLLFHLPRLYLLLRVATGFVSKVGGLYCVLFLSLMIQVLLCSCLRVILDQLDTLTRPEVNASLHELGFQLMYELCVDPVTCGPMVELLWGEKYEFFSKVHLSSSL